MKQRTNLVLVLLLGVQAQLKQIDARNVAQHGQLVSNETSFDEEPPKGYEILPLEGCPTSINVTGNGTGYGMVPGENIIAGRTYWDWGNSNEALSCNGNFTDYNPGRFSPTEHYARMHFSSVIVNPGCKVYVFKDIKQGGSSIEFTSGHISKTEVDWQYILDCQEAACVQSLLWTCTQTYPSCTPSDAWHHITELDNTGSSVTTQFTYEKTVGTTHSEEIKNSMSVSATLAYEIEEGFNAGFVSAKEKFSASLTTGYDWTSTDSATTSTATTYNVQITVPPKTKVLISEVIGKCGDSTVNTQMFKITDTKTGKETVMNGMLRNIKYHKF